MPWPWPWLLILAREKAGSRRTSTHQVTIQNLADYRPPPDWHPGAPWLIQTAWFCLGAPMVASRWLPGSAWRVALLRIFGAHIGRRCRVKPGLRVKYPWRLKVGRACWLAEAAWIDNLAPVVLGDHVCLSQGAYLCTGNHDFRSPTFDLRIRSIRIGSEAWIGAASVLSPGTVVGSGTVIGIGSVVRGDIPENVIVRGNPAAVVGKRCSYTSPQAGPVH
jgi:putative colanic acid biosynthesis acetyltransferase WcaF